MSHQDRPTPEGAAGTAAQLADCCVLPAAPPGDVGTSWQDLYHRASPEQRQQLLHLSAQQGLVHASQLGDLTAVSARATAPALLQVPVSDLPAVVPPPLQPIDASLDAWQREAVSVALATPDICLVQGWPGTGKSRVAAEIVHQAVARGQRVLVVAATAAAGDRVLEQVAGSDSVCAHRCLGLDENLEALPQGLRALTLPARQRAFEEQTLGAARAAVAATQQRLERQAQDAALWSGLEELAAPARTVAGQHQQLAQDGAALPQRIDAEAQAAHTAATRSAFQARLMALRQVHEGVMADLDAQLAAGRAEAAKAGADLAEVEREQSCWQPLANARGQGRWWTACWWQALLQADLPARLEALAQRRTELAAVSAAKTARSSALADELRQTEQQHQAEYSRHVQEELAARLAEIDARRAELDREQQPLLAAAAQLSQRFSPGTEPPHDLTQEAIASARQRWQARRERGGRNPGPTAALPGQRRAARAGSSAGSCSNASMWSPAP